MPPQPYPNLPSSKPKSWFMAFIITAVVLVFSLGFGLWSYASMADYKNNTQRKIDTAVEVAKQQEASRKDNEFAEQLKLPGRTYKGPEAYGSVSFLYPSSWSAYVIEKDKSKNQIDGYFHLGLVPDVSGATAMALRVQVVDTPYSQVMKEFESGVKTGKVQVAPYSAKNVSEAIGSLVTGEVISNKEGATMVVLPVRDKTLKIWTESPEFKDDFNKIVLENLDFVP